MPFLLGKRALELYFEFAVQVRPGAASLPGVSLFLRMRFEDVIDVLLEPVQAATQFNRFRQTPGFDITVDRCTTSATKLLA